jgi:hypothetical protein
MLSDMLYIDLSLLVTRGRIEPGERMLCGAVQVLCGAISMLCGAVAVLDDADAVKRILLIVALFKSGARAGAYGTRVSMHIMGFYLGLVVLEGFVGLAG